mmetsp:Transcript_5084/g.10419  ORF Transcript_5084/g.10419 Transcript_5084/m.10419 type:complete len:251 (-) Transcript_5084:22-774(-)
MSVIGPLESARGTPYIIRVGRALRLRGAVAFAIVLQALLGPPLVLRGHLPRLLLGLLLVALVEHLHLDAAPGEEHHDEDDGGHEDPQPVVLEERVVVVAVRARPVPVRPDVKPVKVLVVPRLRKVVLAAVVDLVIKVQVARLPGGFLLRRLVRRRPQVVRVHPLRLHHRGGGGAVGLHHRRGGCGGPGGRGGGGAVRRRLRRICRPAPPRAGGGAYPVLVLVRLKLLIGGDALRGGVNGLLRGALRVLPL